MVLNAGKTHRTQHNTTRFKNSCPPVLMRKCSYDVSVVNLGSVGTSIGARGLRLAATLGDSST